MTYHERTVYLRGSLFLKMQLGSFVVLKKDADQ